MNDRIHDESQAEFNKYTVPGSVTIRSSDSRDSWDERGSVYTVKSMIPNLDCEAASIGFKHWENISTWDSGAITKNVVILSYQIKTQHYSECWS
jgi:hypothetical protein